MNFMIYASKLIGFTDRRAPTSTFQNHFVPTLQIILESLRYYVSIHNILETEVEKLVRINSN